MLSAANNGPLSLAGLDGVPLCEETLVLITEAGGALMAQSMLDSLPGRDRVAVHRLQTPFDLATTWLMWRKGMRGVNLSAWIEVQQGGADVPSVEQALSA